MAITIQQGWSQQTPAIQSLIRRTGAVGQARRRKKRAGKKKTAGPRKMRAKRASGGKRPARLVKGSAEAKRYMSSIRKKRGKKAGKRKGPKSVWV